MKRATRFRSLQWLLVLTVALLVGLVLPTTAGAATGTVVSGHTYDSVGSAPLPGMMVRLLDEWGNELGYGLTDALGYYEITIVTDVELTNCQLKASDLAGLWVADFSMSQITLAPDTTYADYDFEFSPAGLVSGQVVNSDGTGIPGVTVSAMTTDEYGSEVLLASTETDADGNYVLGGVYPGSYLVKFSDFRDAPQYAEEYYEDSRWIDGATWVDFTSPDANVLNQTVLDAYGFVRGRVADNGGTGIPNGAVEALQWEDWGGGEGTWNAVAWATYEEGGAYTLNLLPGTYIIRAYDGNGNYIPEFYDNVTDPADATPLTINAFDDVSGYDFSLETASHIQGTLEVFGNGPFEGSVYVGAYRKTDDGGYQDVSISSNFNSETGAYDVSTAYTGEVFVRFWAQNYASCWYPTVGYISDATPQTIPLGETLTGIDQVLYPKGSIAGKVTNSSGTGIADVSVEVYDARTNEYLWDFSGTSGAGGVYSLPNLDLGEYKLNFYDGARRYVGEFYNDVADKEQAVALTITPDALSIANINAALVTAGKISGSVTSKTTKAGLAGVDVVAYQIDPNYGWWEAAGETVTDASGNYTLTGAFTGYVKVWAGGKTFPGRWYSDKPGIEEATLIPSTAGSTVYGIDVALNPGSSISGTLKNNSNGTFDGFASAFRKVGDEWWFVDDFYANNGAYKATALEAGDYALRFTGDGYVPEYYNNAKTIASSTVLPVGVGTSRTGVNAVLDKGAIINGAITGPEGMWPRVMAFDVETGEGYNAYISTANTYTVDMLPAGEYKVVFVDSPDSGQPLAAPSFYDGGATWEDATPIPLTADQVVDGIDGQLAPTTTSYSGLMSDGTNGVAGMVELWRVDQPQELSWLMSRSERVTDGSFNLTNLHEGGQYKLSFYPDDSAYYPYYAPGVALSSLADTLTITGSAYEEHTVTDAYGLTTAIQGVGGAGIGPNRGSIRLWYDAGEDGWMEFSSGYTSGVDGIREFWGLFPGSYKIQFVDRFSGYSDTFYGGATLASATAVDIGAAPLRAAMIGPDFTIPLTHLGTAKTRVTLAPSSKAPAYGGSSTLYASVGDINGWPFAGKTVKIYSGSRSSGPWTYRKTLTTGANGRTAGYAVKVSSLTYYRAVYTGPDGVSKAFVTAVKPKAYVSLSAPTTARKNVAFSMSGYLKPRHTAGSYAVKVAAYRYVSGTWKYYKSVSVRVANYSSYSKYTGKIALPYTGRWKLVATHSDTGHAASSSSARYVTVK